MNNELIAALDVLEKEKGISKESLFEAIESNLVVAYKNNFNKADNVAVTMDRETGDFHIYSQKEVVEEVMDPYVKSHWKMQEILRHHTTLEIQLM